MELEHLGNVQRCLVEGVPAVEPRSKGHESLCTLQIPTLQVGPEQVNVLFLIYRRTDFRLLKTHFIHLYYLCTEYYYRTLWKIHFHARF